VVDEFLCRLTPGSVGLDVGCGNGKYLTVNRDIFIIASDRYGMRNLRLFLLTQYRSQSLVDIASQHQPHTAIVADTLNLPHPPGIFDFAISVAVIHHLSSTARRVQALEAILQTLKPRSHGSDGGQALIFVWALEQKTSRRGWDRGDDQDVLVPWVLKPARDVPATTYQRYYHLYREGELEEDAISAGAAIVQSGYDRDNWWVIIQRQD